MPCALACFRKEKFAVLPYPVDYLAPKDLKDQIDIFCFLPSVGNIGLSSQALHEYAGLAMYRLRGYTDSIFPDDL